MSSNSFSSAYHASTINTNDLNVSPSSQAIQGKSALERAVDSTSHLNRSTSETLAQALQGAETALKKFAVDRNFTATMNLAFGDRWNPQIAKQLFQAWAAHDFRNLPKLEIRLGSEINHANGAFASATNTIYISRDFLAQNTNNPKAVTSVLLEEVGHAIDFRINKTDSAGDEGDLFSRLVRGEKISASELLQLKAEDDHRLFILNGQLTAVELSTPSDFGINFNSPNYSRAGNKFVAANGTGGSYLWCTDFAYGRALEKGLIQSSSGIGSKISGNAGVWDDQVGSWGRQARANSIVVWDAYQAGAGSVGHVAFVERTNNDGSFVISEANWGSAWMSFNSRTVNPGSNAFNSAKFIYLENASSNNEASIRQLYRDVHNREADAGGLQYWMGQMTSGMSLSQVRSAFANSQEARSNINTAYRNILLRDAEPGGLQYHLNLLASGATLRGIYEGISSSNEARSQYWVAQYFNNTDRSGAPVFAQSFGSTNTGFDRNWGNGSPSNWVNSDNFSARIFGQVSFGAGLQEIRVQADDGVRVRVGGQTIIDRLVDQPFILNTGTFNAGTGGTFNVEIEYYERGGGAALNFSSRPLTQPDYAGNALSLARNLGTLFANSQGRFSFAANDFVGNVDTNDFYRFSLSSRSTFNLTLGNLSADADLQLIRDGNNNGIVDSSEVIGSSSRANVAVDSLSQNLDAGTYFVRVYQGVQTANTNYSLNFLADLNWGTIYGQNIYGQTLQHQIGIERVDGSSTAISSSRTTWLVIHGMDGDPTVSGEANNPNTIRLLGRSIDGYTSDDQVFYLNWSSAAKSNVIAPIGASWITTVANWAASRLNEWGISTSNINLVGHSLGAYVSAETASRVSGGVNRLVALDPAANHLLGTYNASLVNFSANSWRSWAFYGSNLGDSGRATTADESFSMGFGSNDFWGANHGRVVNLFASMVQQSYTNPNNQISQLFGLNRLFNESRGPWRLNEFNDYGFRGAGIGRYEGRLEGREEWQWDSQESRFVSRWVPKSFRYKQDSDPFWALGLTEITA